MIKKAKDDKISLNLPIANLNEVFSKAIKKSDEDSQIVDMLLNLKRKELSDNTSIFQPLVSDTKAKIKCYLETNEVNHQDSIDNSKTCPNFRYLLRKDSLVRNSEKFVNLTTNQMLYAHPLGIYVEDSNSISII